MGMGVDEPGYDDMAVAVLAVIDLGRFVAELENSGNAPLVVEHETGKASDFAVAVHRDAVDIVEQRVGQCGSGRKQSERQQGAADHVRVSGRWRINALVSCRAPPCACTWA